MKKILRKLRNVPAQVIKPVSSVSIRKKFVVQYEFHNGQKDTVEINAFTVNGALEQVKDKLVVAGVFQTGNRVELFKLYEVKPISLNIVQWIEHELQEAKLKHRKITSQIGNLRSEIESLEIQKGKIETQFSALVVEK